MKKVFSVVIIGAGNIGAFFDSPNSKSILTHAHAVTEHPNFHLQGFVDSSDKHLSKATEIWETKAIKNLEELTINKPDVIVISTPDDSHLHYLLKAIELSPKLIFVEKPITSSKDELLYLKSLLKKNKTPILVNYSRRFCKEFQVIKNDIENSLYGNIICGNGYYGKGLLHNGSHLIDLVRYWLGDIQKTQNVSRIEGYSSLDPSVSTLLTLDNKVIYLQAFPHSKFTIFELDLIFEQGRIVMSDSGFKLSIYRPKKSATFRNYINLAEEEKIETSLSTVMYQAYEHIFQYLSNGVEPINYIEESLQTQLLCHKITNNE